ncbi:hypothetical protein MtrunA17_Chr2g0304341 [Medicago truncatula]|uniref:Leguminosin proline-rich group669 secreted peptide n=1 Tax=Medicago truncatula TaxID=3880 RepID=A0A072V7I0_MEDTR|nr:leguminosin proline-rich group669 secreted peptide [Medicago truncatula]RHN73966.1 hypothetical protein MtrunA17_Chr2g0304341 [Medicago truncatula]
MSHYLSVLVLFLAVITIIFNIAGSPKHQIHAQPDGPIIYQPPTIHQETVGGLNYGPPFDIIPKHRKLAKLPPPPLLVPTIIIPGTPNLPPGEPARPP